MKNLKEYINPGEGDLWAKIIWLRDALEIIDQSNFDPSQINTQKICIEKLDLAESLLKPGWRRFPWFPILKKNHTLVWELLHRIDEDLILIIPEDELYSSAADIKTSFDMNIKEDKIREEWLGKEGGKGRLTEALAIIREPSNTEIKLNLEQRRHIVKGALRIVNEQMDRDFWKLNLNILISVLSGLLLAAAIALFMILSNEKFIDINKITEIGRENTCFIQNAIPVALLGIMGAYLSNIMTTEGFLFVNGPYYRYLLHPIIAKPIMSAFVAVFIYLLEKSQLIFIIGTPTNGTNGPVALNVSVNNIGYAYAVLAVISGFSADKIFRSTIDKVLARLEAKADKSRESKTNS